MSVKLYIYQTWPLMDAFGSLGNVMGNGKLAVPRNSSDNSNAGKNSNIEHASHLHRIKSNQARSAKRIVDLQ